MKQWLLIGVCAMVVACGDNAQNDADVRKDGFTPVLKTKEDSLYHEVMEGHDVGMAKMNKLMQAGKDVKQALDSLGKLPAKKIDTTFRNALAGLQQKLSYAEFSMDTWMQEFKIDSGKGNPELRLQYLEAERDKVTTVKKNILESLQLADSLLKK
ncbi:MAG: viral A-type inclusion protein [Chitinophagaceae bacterium]